MTDVCQRLLLSVFYENTVEQFVATDKIPDGHKCK